MRRRARFGWLALVCAIATIPTAVIVQTCARADDIPIIVTYEWKKQREAERVAARNPKAFWIRQIVARIEDKKPEPDKLLKDPVTVQVTFVVARDGHLVSKAVARSSGNPAADQMAVAMLDRSAPFPPMPPAMAETELTFDLPVRFR